MPEAKNTFLKAKMNKALDDRLLPEGEYRHATNIQITKSDTADVGTAHNILGTTAVGSLGLPFGYEIIGTFFDNRNNRIFVFSTNNTAHRIHVWDADTPDTAASLLVPDANNTFLNFHKDSIITAVNLIGDLLYFSDNRNQPRRINVTKALADNTFYNNEAKISVAKYSPYLAPTIELSYDTTITSIFMKDKFLRFAYRYKFADNEYSIISPFTEIAFSIGTEGTANNVMTDAELTAAYQTTTNDKVVNRINKVTLTVPEPSALPATDLEITHIEFLVKDANSSAIKVLDSIAIDDSSWTSNQYVYTYRSELPTQTLSEEEALRVFDDVPRKAKAQEFIGNRLVYGNITKGFKLPKIDYTPIINARVDDSTSSFNPQLSIKQRREYKVGIVLSDYFGRSTPVILPTSGNATIETFAKPALFDSTNWVGDNLGILFNETITSVTQATASASTNSKTVTLASGGNLSSIKEGQKVTGTGISGLAEVESISSTTLTLTTAQTIGSGVTLTFTNQTISNAYDATNNPLGFYSYKVVVQQRQQEYYNVYNPGILSSYLIQDDFLTLYGDNINKVPRDLTNISENDNTAPSNTRLFPKILNQDGDVNTKGIVQSDDELTRIIDIGSLTDQGFTNSGTIGDYTYKFFEHEKNHLIAQLDTNDEPIGVDAPSYTPTLSVFETEPFESVLDLFYETPTTGLVSDLNSTNGELVIDTISIETVNGTTGSGTSFGFKENLVSNSDVVCVKAKDDTVIVPTTVITLNSMTCGGQDVSSKFEVYFDDVDGCYKLRTKSTFTHVSTTTAVTDGSSSGTNNFDIVDANSLIQVGQAISDGGTSYGVVTAISGTTISRSGSGSINSGVTLTFTGQNDYIAVFRGVFAGTTVDSSSITFTVNNNTANITALSDFSVIRTASTGTVITGSITGDNGDAAVTTQGTTFSIDSSRMINGDPLDHTPLPFELDTFTANSGTVNLKTKSNLNSYSGGEEIAINFKATDNAAGTSIVTTSTVATSGHTAGEFQITLSASNSNIQIGQLVVGDLVPAGVTVSAINGAIITVTGATLSQQVANGTTLSFTITNSQTVATILASAVGSTTLKLNPGSTLSTYNSTAQACQGFTLGEFTDTVTVYHTESNGTALSSAVQMYGNEQLQRFATTGWYAATDGSKTGYWVATGGTGSWQVAPANCTT